MLSKKQSAEHAAPLPTMNQRDAIFDAYTGVLRSGGLTVVHWVYDAGPIFLGYQTSHLGPPLIFHPML